MGTVTVLSTARMEHPAQRRTAARFCPPRSWPSQLLRPGTHERRPARRSPLDRPSFVHRATPGGTGQRRPHPRRPNARTKAGGPSAPPGKSLPSSRQRCATPEREPRRRTRRLSCFAARARTRPTGSAARIAQLANRSSSSPDLPTWAMRNGTDRSSSWAPEAKSSKLATRVRFPSPAPTNLRNSAAAARGAELTLTAPINRLTVSLSGPVP